MNFLAGTALAHATDWDPMAAGTTLAAAGTAFSFLRFVMPTGAFASVIDIADLVTEYEAYYKNDGDKRKRLKSKLYNTGNKFDAHFTMVPTDNTREEFAYSEQTEVLQPYHATWSSKGDHTIKPNVATLFWAKMDLDYVPDHLVLSWAGFLCENNLDARSC